MGRLTDVIQWEARKPGPACKVCVALDAMKPKPAAELRELIARPKFEVPDAAITRYLRSDEGGAWHLGDQAVGRHREGRCGGPHRY